VSHPLDSAYVQLDGARHDLDAFKDRIRTFQEHDAYEVIADRDPSTGDELVRIRHIKPHADFGRQLGIIVQSLRSALDYLIYQLALLDSRRDQKGTQFPIADSPELFESACKQGRLKGLNAEHIGMIESLQPYNGGDWLAVLRDLSNPSKHKTLHTATDFRARPSLQVIVGGSQPDYIEHRLLSQAARWGVEFAYSTEVEVKFHVSVRVALWDGTPVVETLEVLESSVRDLVDTFKSGFD
jgi:hypothetical protein